MDCFRPVGGVRASSKLHACVREVLRELHWWNSRVISLQESLRLRELEVRRIQRRHRQELRHANRKNKGTRELRRTRRRLTETLKILYNHAKTVPGMYDSVRAQVRARIKRLDAEEKRAQKASAARKLKRLNDAKAEAAQLEDNSGNIRERALPSP